MIEGKSIGTVKWFGGYNSKTQSDNKYGFIEDISGSDIFLHLEEWTEDSIPEENEIVIYQVKIKKNKYFAEKAYSLKNNKMTLYEALDLEDLTKNHNDSKTLSTIQSEIKDEFCKNFNSSDLETKKLIFIENKHKAIELLKNGDMWLKNLLFLNSSNIVIPIKEIDWNELPFEYLKEKEEELSQYLTKIDKKSAQSLLENFNKDLPSSLLLFLALTETIDESNSNRYSSKIKKYIRDSFENSHNHPEYLIKYIKNKGGVRDNKVVGHYFDYYLFKKYLYNKNIKFVELYNKSDYLKNRLDIFILMKIFSLIISENTTDSVYSLFMGSLWHEIMAGNFKIHEQEINTQKLFPKCGTVNPFLACEAIYWEKVNIFLCRGKKCTDPKILPDLNKTHLDFTIYDWFEHYGIHFLNEKKPSERDFPIKLAGYFNRLTEIYTILKCRVCSSLMLPDMAYARVDHIVIENGVLVKKDIAPAYRLTVFKCKSATCSECGNGVYINHCMGHDCYGLIDSRDSKTKCSNGLYICKKCASCCSDHARTHPVGLCPDCTSPLKLYEEEIKSFSGRNKYLGIDSFRYVRCSNELCDFTISNQNLTKRFNLPSCKPVIFIKKN